MKFVAYHSPDAPPRDAWLVSLYEPAKGGLRRLPIFFTAPTREAALANAEGWWTHEVERQRKLAAGRKRRVNKGEKS